MAVDPDLQARVVSITGADPSHAPSVTELDQLTRRAVAAIGLDTPAVMAAPVAIYTVDLLGRIASWNQACEELFGYRADEIIGETIPFLPEDELEGSLDGLAMLIDDQVLEGIEYSPQHKHGNRLHVMTSATLLRDERGEPTAVLGFAVDLTAKKEATNALEAAHHKWRHLLRNISDTVTVLDRDCRVKETTGEFTDVLGYDGGSWEGTSGFEFIHPDDLGAAAEIWDKLVSNPMGEYRDVFRVRHEDGHYELIEFNGVSLLHDPVIEGVVMTTRNVTREKQADALLADEAAVLELIARDAPLDDTLPAIAKLVEYHSGGSTAILTFSSAGGPLDIGAPGSVPLELLELVRAVPPTADASFSPLDLRRPTVIPDYAVDPRARSFAEPAARLGVRGGWVTPIIENRTEEHLGVIATYYPDVREPTEHEKDVGAVASHLAAIAIERGRWQRELSHQARHHHLTGLPNRSSIIEHLDTALVRARADGSTVAVMFIDLDHFKVVNDSLGHAAGDKLLVRFGGRLSTLARPHDFVGHFGADGFVVILERARGTDDVQFVANRLELALSEPFALDEGEIFLSTSIGVAFSVGGIDTSETLLQHADAAMFHAKSLGRDRMEIFDTAMRTRVTEQLRIDRDLRLAVERDELAVHYQPKIDLHSGAIIGAEALLRWQHPEKGLVLPEAFIDVAEETGIIVRIGRWVLDEAVRHAKHVTQHVAGHRDFLIGVNLSAREIGAPGLVDQVRRVLEKHALPAHQLVIELTESVLIDDRDATLETLIDLKALGVKLAIDDFGTGFSSLNYLHRFPVDIVKIDRSFVVNLQATGAGSPVATAILHMARALGVIAAAEGVEEPEQLAGLRVLDCDLAQGFLFTEAVPGDDLEALLRVGPTW